MGSLGLSRPRGPGGLVALLRLSSALRYRCVWVRGDYAAASVWIPPHGSELTEEDEERVEPLLEQLVGPRASGLELVERFEASHPGALRTTTSPCLEPIPRYRGRGLGIGLLAENLARLGDAQGLPSYLESTNPDNNSRYERFGVEKGRRVSRHRTGNGP